MKTSTSEGSALNLRVDMDVIPVARGEVYLYREASSSLHLQSDQLDLIELCSMLKKGTTRTALYASTRAESDKQTQLVDQFLNDLRKFDALQLEASPDGLSEAELQRFVTEIAYFSRFEERTLSRFDLMRRLRQSRVLLLGVGGLGSGVLSHLVGCGIGHITIVDTDVVETGNLGRQTFYREADIGKPKVIAAEELARSLSSFTEVNSIRKRLQSSEDIEKLAAESKAQLIIQTADSPIWKLTQWAAEAAIAVNVPLLHTSYLGIGPLFVPGETSCPACVLPSATSRISNVEQIFETQRRMEEGGTPRAVLTTSLGHYAVHVAHEAIAWLSGVGPLKTVNSQLRLSLNTLPVASINPYPPDLQCPVCHGSALSKSKAQPAIA
jgi:bacteriocin biosynthesis cyclodehydratase domain-containing protein